MQDFIQRWQGLTASELSSAQTYVIDLCERLALPRPHPTPAQDYMFERPITFVHGDGSTSAGRVDCYRRGHFVLEAKKLKAGSQTKRFDDGLLLARTQAEDYARALPAEEGRPPFLLVVDVGTVIEVYAEFSRSGATYTPFPDPRSHRIALADLVKPEIQQRLRLIWTDPDALDPAKISARVTREVSQKLARLARSLEEAGHRADDVAAYLSRCLFSMFAEDVELLPKGSFLTLLQRHRDAPDTLQQMLRYLWADMDAGGFSAALVTPVLRFNGKLFKGANADGYSLRLTAEQVDGLIDAARANWREVEPAIFGTLLERALDPAERHALGAHYTPRAYVERLVMPTVIEPLRAEWADVRAAAITLAREVADLAAEAPALKSNAKKDVDAFNRYHAAIREKEKEARGLVRGFLHRLCTVRVLDPACGSGNFLYVTLEHLKRLEGEVLNQLDELGDRQEALDLGRETVTLQQLRGIELNARAAALAELVLWIGYLQWHIRTAGRASVAEPVVHDYGNIENRDAVLAWERLELLTDDAGRTVTRWDGRTMRVHPVTGQPVPDEAAQVPQWRYVNPRPAEWPAADFIVGNPPFIGNKRMRFALGDGYVDALRGAWPDVPESADFVMYWWHKAADTVRAGRAERFGLITTNSLTMIFNRRVIEMHQNATPPLSLAFAVPDHPWVDSADGAAVRIAMSVGVRGWGEGCQQTVLEEREIESGELDVTLAARIGLIHADLSVGANVLAAKGLVANAGLCFQGMNLVGKGFRLNEADVRALGYEPLSLPDVIKLHGNARDLLQGAEHGWVIDFFGHTAEQARAQHPALYQRLLDRVKPEREHNNRRSYRERWWLFGEARGRLRNAWASLPRLIVTAETAKHRIFAFQPLPFCPDHKLYAICTDDAWVLGVLSSVIHTSWAPRAGGRMGVGNDPTWTNTTTFFPFPFPADDTGLTAELTDRIRTLAEQLDAHRKARQAAHPALTLTAMYNVLEKLRSGEPLTAKDKLTHEQGLVGVLQSLHDELDAAVLTAYGWSDLKLPADTDTLLERLVALNARRAAEEAAGTVRWLRPAFQCATPGAAMAQAPLDTGEGADVPTDDAGDADAAAAEGAPAATPPVAARPWPASLPEQIKAVAEAMAASPVPLGLDELAARFNGRGRWRDRLPTLVDTLVALGRLRPAGEGRWLNAAG